MQSKIGYSPRTLKDLDEIWDYIEFELCNPSAAQNTVDGIMDLSLIHIYMDLVYLKAQCYIIQKLVDIL